MDKNPRKCSAQIEIKDLIGEAVSNAVTRRNRALVWKNCLMSR